MQYREGWGQSCPPSLLSVTCCDCDWDIFQTVARTLLALGTGCLALCT